MNIIQNKIDNIDTLNNILDCNELLKLLQNNFEMTAVVYVYDYMKNKNIIPTDETYSIIDKLHSKTVTENNNIRCIKTTNRTLQPRRRIHKIMKGYYYSKALIDKDIVIKFLSQNNYDYDGKNNKKKNILIKNIRKNTLLNDKNINYIISYLNRIHFFKDTPDPSVNNILDYFK